MMTQYQKTLKDSFKKLIYSQRNYDVSIIDKKTLANLQIITDSQKTTFQEPNESSSCLQQVLESMNISVKNLEQIQGSLYITYEIIQGILKNYYQTTDDVLQDLNFLNDGSKDFKLQLKIVEAFNECLEYIKEQVESQLQENKNFEQDPITLGIYFDLFHQIGGFTIQLVQQILHLYTYFDKEIPEINYNAILSLLKHSLFYLNKNMKLKFKEKNRLISYIFEYFYLFVLYLHYLFIQEYDKEPLLLLLNEIYLLFQEVFLNDEASYNNLKEIEYRQQVCFLEIFLSHYNQICQNKSKFQNLLHCIFGQLYQEITNIEDCHYYSLNQLLVVTYYIISIQKLPQTHFLELLKLRNKQIIHLFLSKSSTFISLIGQYHQLLVNLDENQKITQEDNENEDQNFPKEFFKMLETIFKEGSIKNQLYYRYIITQSLVKLLNEPNLDKGQLKHMIKQQAPNNLTIFQSYISTNIQQDKDKDTLNFFLQYMAQFYEIFEIEQQELINKILEMYMTVNSDSEIIFTKLTFEIIINFQDISDKRPFFLLMDLALEYSTKDNQHQLYFLQLIRELIQYRIKKEDLKACLFCVKLLTLSCLSKSDQLRRANQLGNQVELSLMESIYQQYDKQLYETNVCSQTVDYLLFNSRTINSIINEVSQFLQDGIIHQDDLTYLLKIYEELSYIIYLIYWKLNDRNNLQLKGIHEQGIELAFDYYRVTIELCYCLQFNNQLSNNIQIIVNSNLLIAFGISYYRKIIQPIFMNIDLEQNQINLSLYEQFQIHLNQQQSYSFQIVFNKFFEIAYSCLFEVIGEDLDITKQFYLSFLNYLIQTSIQTVLTFQEILPKFFFYLRIERSKVIQDQIAQIICQILIANPSNQSVKQFDI